MIGEGKCCCLVTDLYAALEADENEFYERVKCNESCLHVRMNVFVSLCERLVIKGKVRV